MHHMNLQFITKPLQFGVFLEMRILTKLGTDIVEAERMKPSD